MIYYFENPIEKEAAFNIRKVLYDENNTQNVTDS